MCTSFHFIFKKNTLKGHSALVLIGIQFFFANNEMVFIEKPSERYRTTFLSELLPWKILSVMPMENPAESFKLFKEVCRSLRLFSSVVRLINFPWQCLYLNSFSKDVMAQRRRTLTNRWSWTHRLGAQDRKKYQNDSIECN